MNYIGWLCGRIYVLTLLFRAHTQFDCFNIYILISCLTKWCKAKHMHTHRHTHTCSNTHAHTHGVCIYTNLYDYGNAHYILFGYSHFCICRFHFDFWLESFDNRARIQNHRISNNNECMEKAQKTEIIIIIKLLHKTPN